MPFGVVAGYVASSYLAGEAASDAAAANVQATQIQADAAGDAQTAEIAAAEKAANADRVAALEAAKLNREASAEQLAFQREQFSRWEGIYGDIEENLGEFYNNLTPEYVATRGLQAQQQAYQAAATRTREGFARSGITGGAQSDIQSREAMENARVKAAIRADAPFQVAEQQQSFVSLGTGQGATARQAVGAATGGPLRQEALGVSGAAGAVSRGVRDVGVATSAGIRGVAGYQAQGYQAQAKNYAAQAAQYQGAANAISSAAMGYYGRTGSFY